MHCLSVGKRGSKESHVAAWGMRTIDPFQPLALPESSPSIKEDPSLDHLVRAQEQSLGNRQADRLRGFHVDGELEHGGPLDRHIGRLCAFENAVDIAGDESLEISKIRSVG